MKIRYQPPHPAQGPTIRTARTSKGLSQAELGRRVGAIARRRHVAFSQQYVSRLEHNLSCAAGRTAQALEQVLGVAVPLPKMLPELHALGRQARRDDQRQADQETTHRMSVPRLVAYWPTPPNWG